MRRNKDDRDPPSGRASRRLAQFEGAREPPKDVAPPPERPVPDRDEDSGEEPDGGEGRRGN